MTVRRNGSIQPSTTPQVEEPTVEKLTAEEFQNFYEALDFKWNPQNVCYNWRNKLIYIASFLDSHTQLSSYLVSIGVWKWAYILYPCVLELYPFSFFFFYCREKSSIGTGTCRWETTWERFVSDIGLIVVFHGLFMCFVIIICIVATFVDSRYFKIPISKPFLTQSAAQCCSVCQTVYRCCMIYLIIAAIVVIANTLFLIIYTALSGM